MSNSMFMCVYIEKGRCIQILWSRKVHEESLSLSIKKVSLGQIQDDPFINCPCMYKEEALSCTEQSPYIFHHDGNILIFNVDFETQLTHKPASLASSGAFQARKVTKEFCKSCSSSQRQTSGQVHLLFSNLPGIKIDEEKIYQDEKYSTITYRNPEPHACPRLSLSLAICHLWSFQLYAAIV